MNPLLRPAAHLWADELVARRPVRDLYQPLWKMPEAHATALLRRVSWVALTVGGQYLFTTYEVKPLTGGDVLLKTPQAGCSAWRILNAMMLTPQDTLGDPVRAALRACPPHGTVPDAWEAQVVRLKMRLPFMEGAGVLLSSLAVGHDQP